MSPRNGWWVIRESNSEFKARVLRGTSSARIPVCDHWSCVSSLVCMAPPSKSFNQCKQNDAWIDCLSCGTWSTSSWHRPAAIAIFSGASKSGHHHSFIIIQHHHLATEFRIGCSMRGVSRIYTNLPLTATGYIGIPCARSFDSAPWIDMEGSSCSTLNAHSSAVDVKSVLSNRLLLRKHLLKKNKNERLLHYGRWKNDIGDYSALKEFLDLWAQGRLPSASDGHEEITSPTVLTAKASTASPNAKPAEDNLATSAAATPGRPHTSSNVTGGYPFQDMEVVLEDSALPISVVKFARQSSSLLAVGDESGKVRIAAVGAEARIVQILEHEAGVADLDWSAGNSCLVSCCEDGMVVLWGVTQDTGTWKCLRTLSTQGSATCCRFHAVNQNFVSVGTALGAIHAINASTGAIVHTYALKTTSNEGVFASAMDCSETHLFVGDSRGHLVVLDCDIASSPTGPSLSLVWRSQPPTRERVPVLSVQYKCLGTVDGESNVLTYQADGCACLWSVTFVRNRAPRFLRKVKVMIPAPSPYTNAIFCPTSGIESTDSIALGCLHPGVTVYNLSKVNRQMAPAAMVQLQGHLSPVVALASGHKEHILAAGDVEGSLIIWRNG